MHAQKEARAAMIDTNNNNNKYVMLIVYACQCHKNARNARNTQ